MKLLITGGCGFIGFNLVKYLKSKYKSHINIDIIDNLSRSGSERNLIILKKIDFLIIFIKLTALIM